MEPCPCAQLPVVPDECVEQQRGFAGNFFQPELASVPEPVSPEEPGTPAAPVHFGHETLHLCTSYATSRSENALKCMLLSSSSVGTYEIIMLT